MSLKRIAFQPLKCAKTPLKIAITGADAYSGRYISQLMEKDENITEVRSLVANVKKQAIVTPKVRSVPLEFNTKTLEESLFGSDIFICTYWMRYGFDQNLCPALDRIKMLTDVCKAVGVKRIVYVSHTKLSTSSDIGYIRAKAQAEEYIMENMDSFGFVRPCLLFGDTPEESIVANNTAYLMRRLPVMMFPRDIKKVHFQPVHVRDLAQMALNMALTEENGFIDAVGPEKMTFHQFIWAYKKSLGLKRLLWSTGLSASTVYQFTKPINILLNDFFVEEGDLKILEQDLACSELDENEGKNYWGKRSFTEWLEENKSRIGKEYINSFQRYYGTSGKRNVFSYN